MMFLHIYIRNEVINYIFGSAQLNGSEVKFYRKKWSHWPAMAIQG